MYQVLGIIRMIYTYDLFTKYYYLLFEIIIFKDDCTPVLGTNYY